MNAPGTYESDLCGDAQERAIEFELDEDLDLCPLCGARLQLIIQQTESGEEPAGQCFDCQTIQLLCTECGEALAEQETHQ